MEEILDNGNIQLRSWNKNEIENKTVPPQQLKKVYLNELKMQDLHKSFNKKDSEVESEEENLTNSLKINTTHTLTSTQSNEVNPTGIETSNMHMEGDCLTTNLTIIMTLRQINEYNLTANEACDMDMEGDCLTTKLTMITTNKETNDTKHNEEMEIEEPLAPLEC